MWSRRPHPDESVRDISQPEKDKSEQNTNSIYGKNMTDDENIYWYKISVPHTGIEEYYIFETPLDVLSVREIWLHHVRTNTPMGEYLANHYQDKVEVEATWRKFREAPAEVAARKVSDKELEEVADEMK